MRDAQKFRAYRADYQFHEMLKPLGCNRQFDSLGDIQSYVYGVHRWVRTNRKRVRGLMNRRIPEDAPEIIARPRGDTSTAFDLAWKIEIASREKVRSFHWTERMILHELAHLYVGCDQQHGPVWAAAYLQLVRQWLGKAAADLLVGRWKRHRVRYNMPRPSRRKKLSPTERAAFVERMKRAREAACQRT